MNKALGRYRIINKDGSKEEWRVVLDGNERRVEDSIREHAFENDLEIEYRIYSLCDYGTINYGIN